MLKRWMPLIFMACFSANSAHAMRCGNDLVFAGDHLVDVLNKCGEPAFSTERSELLVTQVHHQLVAAGVVKPVVITEWVYDLGPNQFMRLVMFRNGLVQGIRTLGHGAR